jgi:predicted DNA binding CopG/RHH family protein
MSKGGKQVSFKVPASKLATGADAWISNRGAEPASDREGGNVTALKPVETSPVEAAPKEKMSRFTIDVPESLHRRVKMQCAARGQKMANMMRDLLEREFPAS